MYKQLINIMSAYSDVWVDVLYNRKLRIHLKRIEVDIAYINLIIKRDGLLNKESIALTKIEKELVLMRAIIQRKIVSVDTIDSNTDTNN